MRRMRPVLTMLAVATVLLPVSVSAQAERPYTRADTLRGSIGPERAWWDVEFYDLHVRVDPADSTIAGSNAITYRVMQPGRTLQIDLQQPLQVDSIVQDGRRLDFRRDGNVAFAETRATQPTGSIQMVTVFYQGSPRVAPNAPWDGGLVFAQDSLGRPWIATANQALGASVWWPTKDTQTEEPDSQRVAVTVPIGMVNASNGRLRSVTTDEGWTTYEWFVNSPINNYSIAINAGSYANFTRFYEGEDGLLTLDYWPLDYREDAAREQFRQVEPMMACFEHWFGPYPWYEDGFKLIETPHLGMEHQSAVAYGNNYMNGYRGTDLSGTGLGLEFDFIIIHETGHEWWGNNITTADLADMWVHESFTNYSESLYVECMNGSEADGAEYVIGTRARIQNDRPIVPEFGVNAKGSGDMYYKGGNMLHTVRQLVGDTEHWRGILRGLNEDFRHSIVTGEQIIDYIDERTDTDLEPVFRQYLTTTMLPTLEYRLEGNRLSYRWTDVVSGFAMPVLARTGEGCTLLRPTSEWNSTTVDLPDAAAFDVDRDYYVQVRATGGEARVASAVCG